MPRIEDMSFPEDRRYDPVEHLWVKIEGSRVRIGIDDLGRAAAGTIAYLDLHPPGKRVLRRGGALGTLEANKFVGAIRSPLRGVVVEVNPALAANPRVVNDDPYGAGWFVVLEPSHLEEDLAELVHGEAAIIDYVRRRVAEYRERGILPEAAAPAVH